MQRYDIKPIELVLFLYALDSQSFDFFLLFLCVEGEGIKWETAISKSTHILILSLYILIMYVI